MNKYDALEELAKKASPGEWSGNDFGVFEHDGGDSLCVALAESKSIDNRIIEPAQQACDMRYIAAAHPAAVLGLIADVKALAEALAEISKGAPTTTPEWIESDNHGDTARNAAEMEHHRLSEIARRALARLDGRSCCHHQADCAVHNAPAEMPGPCDCAALSRIQEPK